MKGKCVNKCRLALFSPLYTVTLNNCKLIFVPSKKSYNSKSCDECAVHHLQWKTSENESPATFATAHFLPRFPVSAVIIQRLTLIPQNLMI